VSIPEVQYVVGKNLVNKTLMAISCSARDKEGILNGADIHLARMVGVPRGAEMFVDGSFVVNLNFCDQTMGVNLKCGILIRADISGQY
jgi:hypothetical protein